MYSHLSKAYFDRSVYLAGATNCESINFDCNRIKGLREVFRESNEIQKLENTAENSPYQHFSMTDAVTYSPVKTEIITDRRITSLRLEYLHEILAGKLKRALKLALDAYHAGYPISDIYMDVFQEALYEVGRLWESNRITVADEHMATAITQYVMANLYQYLEVAGIQRGKLVMTGIEGELHQVGANMVADVLEADGWDVMFPGTNVPSVGVIQSVRQHGADLLGISSTMHCNIPKVIRLVEATRAEFGNSVRIMLGGGAFSVTANLSGELAGCRVALNLKEALALARGYGNSNECGEAADAD